MNTPEPGKMHAKKTLEENSEFLKHSVSPRWIPPTCHQLHLLSWVSLSVERWVAAVADLTDQAGGEGHVVPTNQDAGPTLVRQRQREHLHLLLDWDKKRQSCWHISGVENEKGYIYV